MPLSCRIPNGLVSQYMAHSKIRRNGTTFPVVLFFLYHHFSAVYGTAFVHPISVRQHVSRLSCQVCSQQRMTYGVELSKPSR